MIFHSPRLSKTTNDGIVYLLSSDQKILNYSNYESAFCNKIAKLIQDEIELGRQLNSIIQEVESYLQTNFISEYSNPTQIIDDLAIHIKNTEFALSALQNAKQIMEDMTEKEFTSYNFEAIPKDSILGTQNSISSEQIDDIMDDLCLTLFLSHLSQVLD